MNQEELRAILRSGIEAAQNNNPILARQSFRTVLNEDPDHELAWMWLAQVVDTDQERREALQQVVRINPNNDRAREALRRMGIDVTDPNAAPVSALRQAATVRTQQQILTEPRRGEIQIPKKDASKRPPKDMWQSNRRERDNSQLIMVLSLALVAIILIIAALILLIDRLNEAGPDTAEETNTPTGFVVAGELPTNTPAPSRTPVTIEPTGTLPASVTPTFTPSNTPTPTETPVPQPPDNNMSLVFLSAQNNVLFNIRSDGTQQRRLSFNIGDGVEATITDVSYAPTGNRILFSAVVDDRQELFIASATNADEVSQLTSFGARRLLNPQWSPDGSQIAFASDFNGDTLDLYIINADGTGLRRVTQTPDEESEPVWSPDGRYLTYSAAATALDTEIYALDTSLLAEDDFIVTSNIGADVCKITQGPRRSFAPTWSPDGTQLAYLSNRDSADDVDVFIIGADGSARRRLVTPNDGVAQEISVSWSPDGRWLAVVSNRTETTDTQTDEGNGDDPEATPSASADSAPLPYRVWLYNLTDGLWYLISETNAREISWQPTGEIEPVSDIRLTCLQ